MSTSDRDGKELRGLMYWTDAPVIIMTEDEYEDAVSDLDNEEEFLAEFDSMVQSYNVHDDRIMAFFTKAPRCLIGKENTSDIFTIFKAFAKIAKEFEDFKYDLNEGDECFHVWRKGNETIVLAYDND
jgi:hypothetical protein